MSDCYGPVRAFLNACTREFHGITEALARQALRTSAILDRPSDKGALVPDQVVEQFRTAEVGALHAPAIQCAAASPLKGSLVQLVESVMKAQKTLRTKAIRAEDNDRGLPGGFVQKYCDALTELRSYVGAGPVAPPCAAAGTTAALAPILPECPYGLSEVERLTFTGLQQKLLYALNGKERVPIDRVLKAVYNTKSGDHLEALGKLIVRVNARLTEMQRRLEVKKKGDTISLSSI